MEYRQLGNTGVFVSRICLGTMTLGGAGTFFKNIGGLAQHDVNALVENSLDAGVNFVDTANMYSAGEAETLLGKALGRLGAATTCSGGCAPNPLPHGNGE